MQYVWLKLSLSDGRIKFAEWTEYTFNSSNGFYGLVRSIVVSDPRASVMNIPAQTCLLYPSSTASLPRVQFVLSRHNSDPSPYPVIHEKKVSTLFESRATRRHGKDCCCSGDTGVVWVYMSGAFLHGGGWTGLSVRGDRRKGSVLRVEVGGDVGFGSI